VNFRNYFPTALYLMKNNFFLFRDKNRKTLRNRPVADAALQYF
jgi:hypothetical protein